MAQLLTVSMRKDTTISFKWHSIADGRSITVRTFVLFLNFIVCRIINFILFTGTKFQSIESVLGICLHMYGPRSFRQSDITLLNDSRINETIENLLDQEPANMQHCLYGDGIYPPDTHLMSKYSGAVLTAAEIAENRGMTSMRITNEWDYGVTANLFPFILSGVAARSSVSIKTFQSTI